MKSYDHGSAKRSNNPTHESVQVVKQEASRGKPHRFAKQTTTGESIPTLKWDRGPVRKTIYAPLLTTAEKIDPSAWIQTLRKHSEQIDLYAAFDGFENPDLAQIDWYEHSGKWQNRLIHADAKRAMASLLEHEHMAGAVQCVYFDPPYGMDFDARFLDDTLQVTAFRDTYEHGIHTYLSGLRDTLALAYELLGESGSLFLQIGDVNVHRAAMVLDEVFGPENRVSTITFNTTGGGSSSKSIAKSADYLLWYAKDRDRMYFQQLYEKQSIEDWCDTQTFAGGGDFPDGSSRPLRPEERRDPKRNLSERTKLWRMGPLLSQGPSTGEQGKPFVWQGVQYGPGGLDTSQWRVDQAGLRHLADSGRLWSNVSASSGEAGANQLHLKIYRKEMAGRRLTNVWRKTIAPSDKRYPVQTGDKVVERCVLMTTRPGDLVLDPTSGGGTTAVVSETWGRRWIVIDSSRESVAVTRERVLMQNYPAHLLIGSVEGYKKEQKLRGETGQPLLDDAPSGAPNDPATGIVVKRMPYVSAATLAYEKRPDKKPKRDVTWLVDRPFGKKKGRVCGRMTVETELAVDIVAPTQIRRPMQQRRDEDWDERVKAALMSGGFGAESGSERYQIDDLRSIVEDRSSDDSASRAHLRYSARVSSVQTGAAFDAVIAVWPHDARVNVQGLHRMVTETMKRGRAERLVVVAVEFDPGTEGRQQWAVDLVRVKASTDLHIQGVRGAKEGDSPRLFLVAELAVSIKQSDDKAIELTLEGLNEYSPATNTVHFRPKNDIRLWMLDTCYDGLQFHACRIHVTNKARKSQHRGLLKAILGRELSMVAFNAAFGYASHPFPYPSTGQIAVRAILPGGGVATTVVELDEWG